MPGTNKYQCICSQNNPGKSGSDVGTCDQSGVCKDATTNGKAPQLPTPAQPSANQAQPAATQSAQPQESGTAQVSQDQQAIIGAAPAASPENQPAITPNGNVAPQSTPSAGTSIFEGAYEYISGQDVTSAQPAQSEGTGSANPQSGAPTSWLSGAQASLQPGDSGQSNSDVPAGQTSVSYEPTGGEFSSLSSQQAGSLPGLTDQQTQGANAVANETPPQQFASEVNGWIQSAVAPPDSPDSQNAYMTAYGVCDTPSGCNAMEGAPTTATAHPDANGNMTNQIYTLNGYANGQYPYVTVAGASNQQGATGVIPSIAYNDPSTGQTQILQNVPYMVADTGGAIGSGHFDVPITIPQEDYPSVTGNSSALNSILNAQPFSTQSMSVVPTSGIQDSYALANPWNTPPTGGVLTFATQDLAAFPSQETTWANSALAQIQLATWVSSQIPLRPVN